MSCYLKLSLCSEGEALEAMGVLKGLQASPNLSDEEKKLLGEVAKTVEAIIPKG